MYMCACANSKRYIRVVITFTSSKITGVCINICTNNLANRHNQAASRLSFFQLQHTQYLVSVVIGPCSVVGSATVQPGTLHCGFLAGSARTALASSEAEAVQTCLAV